MKIDSLFLELGYIEKSSFENTKRIKHSYTRLEEEKTQSDQPGLATSIFKQLNLFKKQENVEVKNIQRNEKRKASELELNAILSEQCVLCGDYMVDSIQCSVCKPQRFNPGNDGFKIRLDSVSNWDYIE